VGINYEFVGRDDELAFLSSHLDGQRLQLLIIYGRRRAGRTELYPKTVISF